MISTPFDDNTIEGVEENTRARALGIATDINDADEVHARRQQRCTDNVEHYMIQGACWYCDRTQQVIDEAATRDASGASDSEHPAASTGEDANATGGTGDGEVGRAPACDHPRTAIGQFAPRGATPVPEHVISKQATRRANKRMQAIIDKGNEREAVAAYKLLYGQPKAKPTVPASARQAPGVQLPTPPQLRYG